MDDICAVIRSISSETVKPSPYRTNWQEVSRMVVISAGEAEGVLPQMRFGLTNGGISNARIKIVQVKEHQSEAELTYGEDPSQREKPPGIGWKVSTP